jgi:hypothetical protein
MNIFNLKVFKNKANNQHSVTLPSNIFKELEKKGRTIERIDIKIIRPREVLGLKNRNTTRS